MGFSKNEPRLPKVLNKRWEMSFSPVKNKRRALTCGAMDYSKAKKVNGKEFINT